MTRKTATAFTLIEIVVALGLGVVLVVGVQSLVVHSYRVHAALEQRAAERDRYALPLELLGQDLAQLLAADGLTLRDGVLSLTTGNAMQSSRLAARHAVAVRYVAMQVETGGLQLQRCEHEVGQEPKDAAGVVLADRLTAVSWRISDGQTWQATWPPAIPRAAGALLLSLEWADGHRTEQTFALGPVRWRRHNV